MVSRHTSVQNIPLTRMTGKLINVCVIEDDLIMMNLNIVKIGLVKIYSMVT